MFAVHLFGWAVWVGRRFASHRCSQGGPWVDWAAFRVAEVIGACAGPFGLARAAAKRVADGYYGVGERKSDDPRANDFAAGGR